MDIKKFILSLLLGIVCFVLIFLNPFPFPTSQIIGPLLMLGVVFILYAFFHNIKIMSNQFLVFMTGTSLLAIFLIEVNFFVFDISLAMFDFLLFSSSGLLIAAFIMGFLPGVKKEKIETKIEKPQNNKVNKSAKKLEDDLFN